MLKRSLGEKGQGGEFKGGREDRQKHFNQLKLLLVFVCITMSVC